MAKKPMEELRKKSDADLKILLAEKRQALQKFRFGAAGSATRNTKEGRNVRKDIARTLTELCQRKTA